MSDINSDALKIILAKRRTRKEISDLLIKKGYDEQDIQTALQRYEDYINDADYAVRYAHDAAYIKGYGEYRIRAALHDKGVCEQYIDNAISQTEFDLKPLIIKKLGNKRKLDFTETKKITEHFIRRGFASYEISDILRNLCETEEF